MYVVVNNILQDQIGVVACRLGRSWRDARNLAVTMVAEQRYEDGKLSSDERKDVELTFDIDEEVNDGDYIVSIHKVVPKAQKGCKPNASHR